MLAVIQFPIADFRPLLGDNFAGRLPTPRWPPRTGFKAQFVHGFGQAKVRLRGVDYAWTDEVAFCDARRALRFNHLPVSGLPWQRQLNCAFRRLLSDGLLVTRVEAGFSLMTKEHQGAVWRKFKSTQFARPFRTDLDGFVFKGIPDASPHDVLSLITAMPSIVGQRKKNGDRRELSESIDLIRQGKALAKLFYEATTSIQDTQGELNERGWLRAVAPASPVAIIECANRWFDSLPPNFFEVTKFSGGLRLALGIHQTPWGKIDVWWLGYDRACYEEIRRMRICLLRFHAEQHCLSLVLDRLRSGTIPYVAGTESGNRIEAYLNQATRVIDRDCWKDMDISQSQVLAAFDAVRANDKNTVRDRELASHLAGVRLQVRRKVELFEQRSARTINVFDHATYMETNMDQSKTINIGAGATIIAPVTIADTIEGSFNALSSGNVPDDIKRLIEKLLQQIVDTSEVAPQQVAKDLADNAESLSKEVVRTAPRREWYELSIKGLKEAALAVGELGIPILDATGKLLPLLHKLWP